MLGMSIARMDKQMVYRQTARSEKVRAEARGRILRAARKLFAERGYDKSTMQEIVREARTSIGNAYFYFSGKEDLLQSVLEDALRETWARVDEVIASIEPGAGRVAVGVYGGIMSYLTLHRDIALLAVSESSVARRILELHVGRLIALSAANLPGLEEQELLMTAVALGGANRTAVEFYLTGRLDLSARELSAFLVRWHLRAFNQPEPEIERVLRIAARAIKPEPVAKQAKSRRKARRKEASAA